MQKQKIFNYIFIASLVLVAGLLRLFQLGNIPHGFTNDEIVAVYNAFSILKTHGLDASGTFLPLNFHAAGNDLTPAPIYILSLFYALFSMSPFVARLPYALSGIGSVLLLYFLVKHLSKNNALAFLCGLVFAFSPWHLLISRGAWESGVAMFFYLLGIYIFVRNTEKGNILWSLPAFLLAFYSYNADKIFFLAFLPFLILIYRKIFSERKNELVLFICGILLIGVSFFVVLKTNNVSRSNVLLWQNTNVQNDIAQKVIFARQKSTGPTMMQDLFDNKPLALTKTAFNTYLSFFSPQYLVLYADTDKANGYGLFFWGQLYLVDIIFLIFGIYFAATKLPKPLFRFFLTGLLCAPLASALSQSNTDSYLFRSSMAIPFLSFFIGTGIYGLHRVLLQKSPIIRLAIIIPVILIYGFFISKFLYSYYYQFATSGAEAYAVSSRMLTEYVVAHPDRHIFIASDDKELQMQYAFFTKLPAIQLQDLWAKKLNTVNNVTFVADCKAIMSLGNKVPPKALLISPQVNLENCFPTKSLIYQISDSLESLRVIWQVHEN